MPDFVTLSSSVVPEGTRVLAFRGIETISRPYEIEIFLDVPAEGEEMDLADAIGAKARLVLDRADDAIPPFRFTGILASVELLLEVDHRAVVRAVLVPKLWRLGLSRRSCMYTKQSIADVLKTVLEDGGIQGEDVEFRLGSYEPEEHICQYGESDLAFLSRWMEREGIYYFFEHGDDGDKMIVCDDVRYGTDAIGKPVVYRPQLGADASAAGPSFRTFTCRHATLPASVRLKDYDYAKPSLDVSGSADVASNGVGDVNLNRERFFTPSAGKRYAKLRAEELLARQVTYRGTATRLHLRAGYVFELDEHPRASFNEEYLVYEARHQGNQAAHGPLARLLGFEGVDDVYTVEVEAIPSKTQFRPESRTPWPRIYCHEHATIDGPATSEYAQLDDQGRYLVKFFFDESTLKDGKASTYIRMMQPHGGAIEGFHFPLRKGTEVLVTFLGGDPDRPVIAGFVPNAQTPSPVTSANHTRNVIQTGGRNRFELEDLKGKERITLQTPYANTFLRMGCPNDKDELIAHTDDNGVVEIGKTFRLDVGHHGGGSWNTKIKQDWTNEVEAGDYELFVDAGCWWTSVHGQIDLHAVTGDVNFKVEGGNHWVHVDSGKLTTDVHGATKTTVTQGVYEVHVNGGNTLIDTHGTTRIASTQDLTLHTGAHCKVEVTDNMTVKVGGDVERVVTGKEDVKVIGYYKHLLQSDNINITAGMTSSTFIGLSNANQIGASVALFAGGQFTASYSYAFAITGGASMAMKYGLSLTVDNTISLTMKPIHVKQTSGPVLKRAGVFLANRALNMIKANTHVIA